MCSHDVVKRTKNVRLWKCTQVISKKVRAGSNNWKYISLLRVDSKNWNKKRPTFTKKPAFLQKARNFR